MSLETNIPSEQTIKFLTHISNQKIFPLILWDSLGVIFSFLIALAFRFDGQIPANSWQFLITALPFFVLLYCIVNVSFSLYAHSWQSASAQEINTIIGSTLLSTTLLGLIIFFHDTVRPFPLSVVMLGGIFTTGFFIMVRYRKRLLTGAMDRLQKMDSSQKVVFSRDITPTDLLGRQPYEIDKTICCQLITGKVILVTGAAGSIGSELCRQILNFRPAYLLMLDNNESGLHELLLALKAGPAGQFGTECPLDKIIPIVADVTNQLKMDQIFGAHRPQLIFHAAAYKHVPLMEQQPDEAVRVNVLGTKIVAELAAYYAAERFVFVSSDKAINPSSIMGATKRLGEILTTRSVPTTHNYYMIPISNSLKKFTNGVQPHHGHGAHGIRQNQANREINAITMHPTPPLTLFTAVRFGNVLGSRGSVVPTFARQIELGGPVTITHPEMKRYFISIAEAVSLVIQAAALTQGNDLFMLDMGQEVRIADLAHKMIRLRGLRPGEDISIQYTGIRPGEKLNEELLAPGEERLSTNYAKIFRIRSNNCLFDKAVFSGCLDQLIEMARAQQTDEMLELLWKLVQPETLLIKDEKMISKSLELEYEWGQNRFL